MEHPLWARSETFKYVLRWMAHLVQYPGTNPEVMIVIRSDREGAGKSSLGHWLFVFLARTGRRLRTRGKYSGRSTMRSQQSVSYFRGANIPW